MGINAENVEKALRDNGFVVSGFSGVSMYPLLRQEKDMVLIESINRPLKKYDVPLYKGNGDKYILHRILKVLPSGYIIRGDNLYKKESDVTDDKIIGVLKGFYRNGKYVSCENNLKYKAYIIWVVWSYPFRFIWHIKLRPFLGRCKRYILGKRIK